MLIMISATEVHGDYPMKIKQWWDNSSNQQPVADHFRVIGHLYTVICIILSSH